MIKDQVFAMRDGFYCIVDGRTFGPWALREYAEAGLQVEKRRAELRKLNEPLKDVLNDQIIARLP